MGRRLRAKLEDQPRAQPVQEAAARQHFRRAQSAFRRLRPFFGDGFVAGRAAQDQPVRRARQGHVKQAQFFAESFAFLAALGQPMRQAGIKLGKARRLDLRTEAQFLVQNHPPAGILQVEALAQIRQRHDGKFQPLALVNAHQAHGVPQRLPGRLGVQFVLLLRLDKLEETVKPLAAKTVKLPCQVNQAGNIGGALGRRRARRP